MTSREYKPGRKTGGEEKNVVEVSHAVSEAVKLCEPDVMAIYPITPQTHVSEGLSQMKADGEVSAEKINVESEQSAMSACIGAQATGLRAYTATSSQGLALMHEMLFIASSMRLPVVMTVVNRSLSAPLSIWNDQQDSFSQRDTGWIQLYVEDGQEAHDTQVQAFRIAQEANLPVMVCIDGFMLSHVYEPVEYMTQAQVSKFVPKYKPEYTLDPGKPVTMGTLGTPQYYMRFRKQLHDAVLASRDTIRRVNSEFSSSFGRSYGNGLIEEISMKERKHALITIGSVTGTARAVAEKEGVGIIKVRALRPFPEEDLRRACSGLESVGVLEKDISLGANGSLFDEVKAALYGLGNPPVISNFIAGIGGRDITMDDLSGVMRKIKAAKELREWLM
jgi:pyruvate ferredoxin oxidoreductase alpha subunit